MKKNSFMRVLSALAAAVFAIFAFSVAAFAEVGDGGFTAAQIEGSANRPTITVAVDGVEGGKVFDPADVVGVGKTVTIKVNVSGADKQYASTGLHIYYDKALDVVTDDFGDLAVTGGRAISLLSPNPAENDPTAVDQGMKGFFVGTAGGANYGRDGTMWTFYLKVPATAQEGVVFGIDIIYKPSKNARDCFLNAEDDEAGKIMQAYAFTRGIYNSGSNNTFAASAEDVAKCPALADIDKSYDAYIAIGKKAAPAHTHDFTYSASGDTITAECSADGCTLTDKKATLTIGAPALTAYGGTESAAATITDANGIQGEAKVQYQTRNGGAYGTATETAPTDAGKHKASITLGTGNNTATAYVEYEIAPMALTITGATATNRAYDKDSTAVTISEVKFEDSGDQLVALTLGENNDYTVAGAMTDVNAGDNKEVTVTVTLKNANYSLAANTATTTVNISKAAAQTIADVTDSQIYTVTSVFESVAGKMPDDAGTLTYTAGDASKTGSVTVSDFAVDTDGIVSAKLSDGAAGDTVTLPVTISSTNYADSVVNVKITLIEKGTQTITADDVTATYGDTDKGVDASTDGDGAISYAVKDGSGDYIDVDASTGALTIKAVPADGKAYVTVTAAETDTYKQATEDVTVTISKADAAAAAVTANNRAYDETEQPLVTVTGEATGGEMQYALGTETEATEQYTASIPTATDADTYYVWYMVEGDDNHNDSEAACEAVTIDPASVTLTANSGTETYDGSEKTVTGFTCSVEGLTFADTVTASGSGTDAGEYDVTFSGVTVNETKDSTGNYVVTETIDGKLTIGKADITPTVTLAGWYVGWPANTPVVDGNPGNGAVTYSYKVRSAADDTYSPDVPTWIGFYTVKATIAETENYNGGEATADFVIAALPYYPTSGAPTTPGTPNTPPDTTAGKKFIDASVEGEWYYDAVYWAADNGIMEPDSSDYFGVNDPCSRAEMVLGIWKAMGSPEPVSAYNPFVDVFPSDPYYKAVLWAVQTGVTKGMDKTHFGPSFTVTRGQSVTFLYRAAKAGVPADAANPFLDVRPKDYYYEAILWAVANGITNGVDEAHFDPAATLTKGHIVTFLFRQYGKK